MRLFKWVVSYATWKYGVDSTINVTSNTIGSNIVDNKSQNVQGYGFVPSPTRTLVTKKSTSPEQQPRKSTSHVEEKLSSTVNNFIFIYFDIKFIFSYMIRLKKFHLVLKYIVKENLKLKLLISLLQMKQNHQEHTFLSVKDNQNQQLLLIKLKRNKIK